MYSPEVIPLSMGFQAYDDGSGTNPVMQVKLVSKEEWGDLMAPGRARMLAAAAIIANEARALSAPWSEQIPATMKVEGRRLNRRHLLRGRAVLPGGVQEDASAVRRPEHWYSPPGPPFLGLDRRGESGRRGGGDPAKTIPDFCRSLGFTVT